MLRESFNIETIFNKLFGGFDLVLLSILFSLFAVSTVAIYSAAIGENINISQHWRNVGLCFILIWIVAQIPIYTLMKFAIPLYTIGVLLLISVAMFGLVKKGARRWIDLGVIIQPAELMKIAMPLMLAWYFHKREQFIRYWDFIVGLVILLIPCILIAKQPDLGTAILVFAAGFYVIFFAGFSWKIILPILTLLIICIFLIITYQDNICASNQSWQPLFHDYQKYRVCTLLNPNTDPLGKGFHILQSMIAIGSGGLSGKGWLKGTQTHLEFIPEKHTDFIFAVYSEEFGFIGNIVLLLLYSLLIFRSLYIASKANLLFSKLVGSAIALMFFTYAFVNMSMVIGILPVVGIPLPFMSYGGTALVTLGMGIGILMSIARHNNN